MDYRKELIEQLRKQNEVPRRRSGKYSPSSFGKCYRNQYWNRKNETVTNPANDTGLILMYQGTKTHELIQDFYPKDKIEQTLEDEDFKGRYDIGKEDAIQDIKCMEDWKYKKYHTMPTDIYKKKNPNYFLQCSWYVYKTGKEYIEIRANVFGMLNLYAIHRVKITEFEPMLMQEIAVLKEIWLNDTLPPAEPRLYGGNECNYCQFKDKCKSLEKEGKE